MTVAKKAKAPVRKAARKKAKVSPLSTLTQEQKDSLATLLDRLGMEGDDVYTDVLNEIGIVPPERTAVFSLIFTVLVPGQSQEMEGFRYGPNGSFSNELIAKITKALKPVGVSVDKFSLDFQEYDD